MKKSFDWKQASDHDLALIVFHGDYTEEKIKHRLRKDSLDADTIYKKLERWKNKDKLSGAEIKQVMKTLDMCPTVVKFHYLRHFYFFIEMKDKIDSKKDWLKDIADLREITIEE